jgi:hypothetical protein
MYSNMENISSVVLKKYEKLRFLSLFFMVAVVGGVEKTFFSDLGRMSVLKIWEES